MSHSFAPPMLPSSLRVCRALVWTQAGMVVLGGLFVLFTVLAFGAGDVIPVRGGSLSGGGAAVLGGADILAGLVLAGLGLALGRLAARSAPAIAAVEVLLTVLYLVRSLDLSVSTVLTVAMSIAVLALLAAPGTRRALALGATT